MRHKDNLLTKRYYVGFIQHPFEVGLTHDEVLDFTNSENKALKVAVKIIKTDSNYFTLTFVDADQVKREDCLKNYVYGLDKDSIDKARKHCDALQAIYDQTKPNLQTFVAEYTKQATAVAEDIYKGIYCTMDYPTKAYYES